MSAVHPLHVGRGLLVVDRLGRVLGEQYLGRPTHHHTWEIRAEEGKRKGKEEETNGKGEREGKKKMPKEKKANKKGSEKEKTEV